MSGEELSQGALTPDGVVEYYGLDALVLPGRAKEPIALGQALALEDLMCKVPREERQAPAARVTYMLRILRAAGTLLPEHEHLLADAPSTES